MSEKIIFSIKSKHIRNIIFKHLDYTRFIKIIKHNKALQKDLDINFEEELINYEYIIKEREQIVSEIENKSNELSEKNTKEYIYINYFNFSPKFCLIYSYLFPQNIDIEKYDFF